MRKYIEQDERVLAQKRQIGSGACQLLMIYLIASVLVQQYIFNAPFSAYAVEFFGFFGASLYIIIKNLMVGNDLYPNKQKKTSSLAFNSLISGLAIALVSFVANFSSIPSPTENVMPILMSFGITFLIGSASYFLFSIIMVKFNAKRIASLEKEFEED